MSTRRVLSSFGRSTVLRSVAGPSIDLVALPSGDAFFRCPSQGQGRHRRHRYQYGEPMDHLDAQTPAPGSRRCPECGRVLARTLANWHSDPSCHDFLRGVCRDCINAQRRARYQANPEPVRARERQRRAARAELMRNSPLWRQTEHQTATDQLGSVASYMTPER
ncbi:hypothetical protein SGPA1_10695 [Streptomyces misionensis JCM 4497]